MSLKWFNVALPDLEEVPKKKVYVFKNERKETGMKLSDLTEVEKAGAGQSSKYDKYDNQLVIVIVKGGRLILSKYTLEKLGTPTFVKYYTDGKRIIAIAPSKEEGSNTFKVQAWGADKKSGAHYGHTSLSCGKLLKDLKYNYGDYPQAYMCEFHDGAVWLDLSHFPARV